MRLPVLFSLALMACGLAALPAAAQTAPANDQCQNAQLLANSVWTPGSTFGATDNIPGLVGCQTGTAITSYPEVWYAFVASASTLHYRLRSNYAGDTIALHLFSGSCGALILENSFCGSDSIVGSHNGLVLGSTYYLAVTDAPANGFVVTIQVGGAMINPAQDCDQAVVLAQLTTIQQGSLNMGAGIHTNEVSPLNSCFGGGERQSKWYRFTAGSTGVLEFNVNPIDPQTDYDWAVWDITANPQTCTADPNHVMSDAIACNWTGARGATGLSLCEALEPGFQGGDQFDNKTTMQTGANAPILVHAGRVYALLVDNFTLNGTGYTLTFGGACGPAAPGAPAAATLGLGATFMAASRPGMRVDFTPDVTVGPGLAVSYRWSFGDGGTSTQITPSHTYAAAGTYYTTLIVTDLLGTTATYGRALTASVTGVAEEVARAARLSLSPNPATQTVRLTLAAPAAAGSTAQLFNALGRLVRTVPMGGRETTADLNLDGLRAGVYSVRVGGEVRRLVIAE